jgi:hypothetical protein
MQGVELGTSNNGAHAGAHSYIGGNLSDPHISFRDPFVFLVHANADRLWAMWQQKNVAVRLNPMQVYGNEGNSMGSGDVEDEGVDEANWGILSPIEPWAGFMAQTPTTGIVKNTWPIRPWYTPENEQCTKSARDISIVIPPRYDTF